MPRLKFDDCASCRFRRRPRVCADCDYGEMFEEEGSEELRFAPEDAFSRAQTRLVSADDEPDHNPDDMIRRAVSERDEQNENDEQEENEDE